MITRTLVDVYSCTCERCGHVWRSEELSARCPKCKSPAWEKNGEQAPGRPRKEKFAPVKLVEDGDELVAPIVRQSTASEQVEGKCPHKKMRGELCYKCDKKFGMPKLKTGR